MDDDNQDDPLQDDPQADDQKLPEDYGTPFSPPDDVQDKLDATHPATDSNIDPHQRYDEGTESAANIDLPGEGADEDQDISNA